MRAFLFDEKGMIGLILLEFGTLCNEILEMKENLARKQTQ